MPDPRVGGGGKCSGFSPCILTAELMCRLTADVI